MNAYLIILKMYTLSRINYFKLKGFYGGHAEYNMYIVQCTSDMIDLGHFSKNC